MEKKTPLYNRHVELGGKIVPFAGYMLPIQYPHGIIKEHMAVRTAAGLFDVSHMGELMLKGTDALKNLQYVVANDCDGMADGQCRYTPLCNENSGTCLNRGCIPAKVLLHTAEVYHEAHTASELGLNFGPLSYDMNAIHTRKAEVCATLRTGAEGLAAVEMMCGNENHTDLALVPSCLYTSPEVACVGITADQAKQDGIAVKTAKYVMSGNGKSIITREGRGFVKLVLDAETEKVLGIQMMCARATDLISEWTNIIANGMTKSDLLKGMRPHPTYCEGITEMLEAVDGKAIHIMPAKKR